MEAEDVIGAASRAASPSTKENTMKISSPVVGEIEVSPERVITFPAGLPGFEACQFALLHAEGNDAPKLFMLQSLDDADVGFTVTTPDILGLNYEFALSDAEVDDLQLTDPTT
jgi:flagellar assembly factor FliW